MTADIYITEKDTRRIVSRLTEQSKPVPLTGWTDFEMLVDPNDAPESGETRVMLVGGIVIDAAKGRVAFVQTGDVPVGRYYYQMRAIDPNGERITFLKGRYIVSAEIP